MKKWVAFLLFIYIFQIFHSSIKIDHFLLNIATFCHYLIKLFCWLIKLFKCSAFSWVSLVWPIWQELLSILQHIVGIHYYVIIISIIYATLK